MSITIPSGPNAAPSADGLVCFTASPSVCRALDALDRHGSLERPAVHAATRSRMEHDGLVEVDGGLIHLTSRGRAVIEWARGEGA